MEFFCNTNKRTPLLCQSNIFYESFCPGCSANHVSKTERIFHKRHHKDVYTDKDSIINNHIDECDGTKYLFSLCHLNSGLKASIDIQIHSF